MNAIVYLSQARTDNIKEHEKYAGTNRTGKKVSELLSMVILMAYYPVELHIISAD